MLQLLLPTPKPAQKWWKVAPVFILPAVGPGLYLTDLAFGFSLEFCRREEVLVDVSTITTPTRWLTSCGCSGLTIIKTCIPMT